jgi:O-antigen/teichoic acid export membrane protein
MSTPASPPESAAASGGRAALITVYVSFVVRYATLLVLLPFYTRVLGPSEYGQVLAAMALYGMVWAVVNWGYSMVGTRTLAAHPDQSDRWRDEVSRQIGGRLALVPAGVLLGVVGTLCSPVLRSELLIGALATAAGITSAFNLGWLFQALRRFRTLMGLEVCTFVMQLVLVLAVVRAPDDGVLVVGILLVSLMLPTLLAYAISWRLTHGYSVRWDQALFRESTPVFALINVASMSLLLTTYLLSLFAPADVVGWFGTAERIASILVAAMGPAAQVMLGAVTRKLNQSQDVAAAHRLMALGVACLTAFGLVTTLVVIALAPSVVPWVLGDDFRPTATFLQQLVVFLPFAAFVQAVSIYVLVPSQRESAALLCVAVGAGSGLALLCALGPYQPGLAAVGSRILAESLTAVALAFVLVRYGLAQALVRSLQTRD